MEEVQLYQCKYPDIHVDYLTGRGYKVKFLEGFRPRETQWCERSNLKTLDDCTRLYCLIVVLFKCLPVHTLSHGLYNRKQNVGTEVKHTSTTDLQCESNF